jgi:hypothetical protein
VWTTHPPPYAQKKRERERERERETVRPFSIRGSDIYLSGLVPVGKSFLSLVRVTGIQCQWDPTIDTSKSDLLQHNDVQHLIPAITVELSFFFLTATRSIVCSLPLDILLRYPEHRLNTFLMRLVSPCLLSRIARRRMPYGH